MGNTTTKTEAINNFLEEIHLNPRDLANYLEQNFDYSCFSETQYNQ